MGMDKYVPVGRLGKVHGLGGFLRVKLEVQSYWDDVLQAGVLFVGDEQAPLPYFIAEVREEPTWLVQFEDIPNREAAEALAGEVIYLRESDLSAIAEPTAESTFVYMTGYTIDDVQTGRVGVIEDVVEYPQQWMAILMLEQGQVLVPLHEDLIEDIDAERRVVRMNLPEGLLDL